MNARLSDTPVLLLDCQTTGPSPERGALLELGWAVTTAKSALTVKATSLVLAQPAPVPRRIRQLTGIKPRDVADGVTPEDAWQALMATVPAQPTLTVIHYARFERPFLKALHQQCSIESPWPFRIVCTHEIARRLFPGLPRRGIRALAGYLGHEKPELKRAAGHVEATAAIWEGLAEILEEEHEIHTLEALELWLQNTKPVRSSKRAYPLARDKRLALPKEPGVYHMLDRRGTVLYVGKATSLKSRVNSYFRKGRSASERLLEMVTRIWDVSVIQTASPLEAALLETDAIKDLDPAYNIALKTGDRQIVFASPDFKTTASEPSSAAVLGPIPGNAPVHALAALVRLLCTGSTVTVEDQAQALLLSQTFLPQRATMLEGIELAKQRYPLLADATPSGLMRVGGELWMNVLRERGLPSEAQSVEPAEEEERRHREWTAEDVVVGIAQSLTAQTRAIRWASLLCQLCDASVAWWPTHTEGAARRCLVLERGRVVEAKMLEPDAPLPVPPGFRRSRAQRQAEFDVPTYDRLRVLTTELRRVLGSGNEAQLCLGPGVVVEARALKRLLEWA